jgi:hypothetical protein
VDDLPGISIKTSQAVADDKDRASAANLIRRVIANALERMVGDVVDVLNRNDFSLQPAVGNIVVGQYRQGQFLDLTQAWRGVWLEPIGAGKRSRNTMTQVNRIEVYSQTPATLAVKLVGVEETIDYTVTTVANPGMGCAFAVIAPYAKLRGSVKVLVQADAVPLADTKLSGNGSWCGNCSDFGGWGWGLDWWGSNWFGGCVGVERAYWATGATADAGLTISRTDSNSGGVRVDATLVCDPYQFVCSLLPQLSEVAKHGARIAFAQEIKLSQRINYVTLNAEQAIELEKQATEEYQAELSRFGRNLRTHLNKSTDECLTCTGNRITSFRP